MSVASKALPGIAGRSLGVRALLALALMLAFFVLSLAAVIGLGRLGIWIGAHALDLNNWRLILMALVAAAACLIAAGAIAWSVLPRVDRFEPPGMELFAATEPRLFAEIRDVAALTGQRAPAHVYVVPDVNAFVTERGGVMGVGSRRVMGVGLPLFDLLSVSELRAVIAHEFGHFHGGDTKLGPWTYKVRGAVGRAIDNLARIKALTDQGSDPDWPVQVFGFLIGATRMPFLWYGALFLRITGAVSRAQERSADALAARVIGSEPLAEGLKKTRKYGGAYSAYLDDEVSPVLSEGFAPPLTAGFRQFCAEPRVSERIESAVEKALESDEIAPGDSHPPLRERVALAEQLACPTRREDPRRAAELVDLTDLERQLVAHVQPNCKPIDWSDTVARVWEPKWQAEARRASRVLAGLTPATLPRGTSDLERLLCRRFEIQAGQAHPDMILGWSVHFVGSCLSAALLTLDYRATADPGQPIRLQSGDRVVEPFGEFAKFVHGEIDEVQWQERMRDLELADVQFSTWPAAPG